MEFLHRIRFEHDHATEHRLDRLEKEISVLKRMFIMARQQFEDLLAQVEGLDTTDDSIYALMDGMALAIEELKKNPSATEIQAVADRVRAIKERAAAAVVAHTPAAEPPVT